MRRHTLSRRDFLAAASLAALAPRALRAEEAHEDSTSAAMRRRPTP